MYRIFFSLSSAILDQSSLILDDLGDKFQTDKAISHDYTKIYNFYFENIRNNPINFLEIGFLKGCSARMWDEYFTNAALYFIDIDRNAFKNSAGLSSRCHFYVADQAKKKDLLDFVSAVGEKFDIIMDDGGHTMEQQQTSFSVLFPHVKEGGVYIIEDLHTSYWESFGTGSDGKLYNPKLGKNSTVTFLLNLVNDLNYIGAYTGHANMETAKKDMPLSLFKSLTAYQKEIKSIHFYRSLCFIFK